LSDGDEQDADTKRDRDGGDDTEQADVEPADPEVERIYAEQLPEKGIAGLTIGFFEL
jgi:hypothetical protein